MNDRVRLQFEYLSERRFAGTLYSGRGVEADINMLSREGPALLERAWAPEMRIDGLIATVWTRYDFHVDGAFSHDNSPFADAPAGRLY